ncbi:MAG: T9SS type A sorting domain-containing protein [bacterium]
MNIGMKSFTIIRKQQLVGTLLFFLLYGVSSFAQIPPKIKWQKCFGGSGSDGVSGRGNTSMIQLPNGTLVIAAAVNSRDGSISDSHGNLDVCIFEIAPSGDLLWEKCFGGSADDVPNSIIQTSDGGFVVAGWTTSLDGGIPYHIPVIVPFNDTLSNSWVFKISNSGEIQWQVLTGGYSGASSANAIIQTADGGYAVAGWTTSDDEGLFNNQAHDDLNQKFGNAYLAKLTPDGKIQWQRCYGGHGPDGASSLVESGGGDLVFIGGISNSDVNVGVHGFDSNGKGSSQDVWMVRVNSRGDTVKQQRCLGGRNSEIPTGLLKLPTKGFVFSAYTRSFDGDVSSHHLGDDPPSKPGFLNLDAWVVMVDSDFNIIWEKCFGGERNDNVKSITYTSDSGFLVIGDSRSRDGDVDSHIGNNDSSDLWVIKLDKVGRIQWHQSYGGLGDDFGLSICQASGGDIIFCGTTNSVDGEVLGNHGKFDVWIARVSNPQSAPLLSTGNTYYLWPFPNPATVVVNLHLSQNQNVRKVEFLDLLGIQYYPPYKISNDVLTIDTHDLPAGSFIVRVAYQNTTRDGIRKFVHVR